MGWLRSARAGEAADVYTSHVTLGLIWEQPIKIAVRWRKLDLAESSSRGRNDISWCADTSDNFLIAVQDVPAVLCSGRWRPLLLLLLQLLLLLLLLCSV